MRKLTAVLLATALCLASLVPALAEIGRMRLYNTPAEYEKLTGNKIKRFNEAPMLRTKVAAGELPSVEKRLPEEPLVVEPIESLGKYGGEVVFLRERTEGWGQGGFARIEPLLGRSLKDPNKVVPNIAKDWNLSKDAKSFTLYLRKGIRWSDGAPFTADDFLFWYNDFLLNEELSPLIPKIWKPGGEVMKVEKVDDYTIRFKFAVPWAGAINAFSYPLNIWSIQGPADGCYAPAHYLKRFHIKYNPDADKLAKKEGFDHWYQLFQNRAKYNREYEAKDLPVLGPWILEVEKPDHVILTRNPYYWKIDIKGNQLPYIDKIKAILAEQPELAMAKIFAGEPDYIGEITPFPIKEFPVIKKTAKKNNYEIFLIPLSEGGRVGEVTIFPNHTVKDTFIKELFNNVKFKRALALAIDRNEINKAVFLGTAEPIQIAPPSTSPFYDEEVAKAYTQYDPERAKKLLDEIGLKRDKEGYILRPDGSRLILVLEVTPFRMTHMPSAELIKEFWDKIGVKMVIHSAHGGTMWELFNANESQLSLWVLDRISYDDMMISPPWWGSCYFWGREWNLWFASSGKTGTEPPSKVKQFVNIWDTIPYTVDKEERIEMAKNAFKLEIENLWMIGVVGNAKAVGAHRASLKNVNRFRGNEQQMQTFQWYWEK